VKVYARIDRWPAARSGCGRHARPSRRRRSSSANCSSRPRRDNSPRRTPPWPSSWTGIRSSPTGTCRPGRRNEVYIRRVIKVALGHLQVRKIRGLCSTCSTRSW